MDHEMYRTDQEKHICLEKNDLQHDLEKGGLRLGLTLEERPGRRVGTVDGVVTVAKSGTMDGTAVLAAGKALEAEAAVLADSAATGSGCLTAANCGW
jgi:hypothetical protein